MGISDWTGIICSVISLIVTILIAALQMRQSNRINKLEQQQNKKEEIRYWENIKAQTADFISKYYKDRGLIPLCAIAAMYNDSFFYTRQMYNEFCHFPNDLKNTILEYCKLDLFVSDNKNIFGICINELQNEHMKYFPEDKNIFYDGGKYIERSLTIYGCNKISNQKHEYESHITDILSKAYRETSVKKPIEKPIEKLCLDYNFGKVKEEDACWLATVVAEFIAIYSDKNMDSIKNFGSPGSYDGETIDTMEDLFLLALFEIYTNFILV